MQGTVVFSLTWLGVPSLSFVCVVLAESSLLMKLSLVVSAGFLLVAAETQGGGAARD